MKPADRYLLTIFTFPFGAYYAAPVDALVCEHQARAFPGGVGDVKAAGNYAAAMLAELEARDVGFNAVLWLDAMEHAYVEESGAMNVFFVMGETIVTPPLEGTILAGVTRDAVITIAREAGLEVVERRVAIGEVFESFERGALSEAFGTGTAAVLSQLRRIRHGAREIRLPGNHIVGPMLREKFAAVASGAAPDRHKWLDYV